MKKLLTIFLFLITVSISAQEKVLLRFNYEKGEVFETRINTAMEITDKVNTDMVMYMLMEILESNDDSYTTKVTFPRVTMDMEGEGKKMNYDSDMKEEDMDEEAKKMHERMGSITETIVHIEMSNRGEILNTKVIEAEEGYEYNDVGSSIVFPEEPVSVGTKWDSTKEVSGFPMKYEYTITSIDAEKVGFDVTGTMDGIPTEVSGNGFIRRDNGLLNPMDITMIMDMFGQKMITKMSCVSTKK